MKKAILSISLAIATLGCSGQNKTYSEFGSGNVKVAIEQGDKWLHDFSLFWFIKKKNTPQIAIWTEDTVRQLPLYNLCQRKVSQTIPQR